MSVILCLWNVKLTWGKKLNIKIAIFKHLSIFPKNLLIQTANTFQNNSFRKYFLNRIPIKILNFLNKYTKTSSENFHFSIKLLLFFQQRCPASGGRGKARRNCGQFPSYRTGKSKSPFPPSLPRRQLPEEFIAGNEQDSLPGARLLFKGTRGEEGEGKKRGIRNRRFLCLPRNALFVAPGEAEGGMFNFSHANPPTPPGWFTRG